MRSLSGSNNGGGNSKPSSLPVASSSSATGGGAGTNSGGGNETVGSLASKRKIRTKKWATVYTEKIAKNDNDDLQNNLDREEVRDWLSGIWARTMIAKKLSKIIKQKIRMKSHSCKKSLLNLQYPSTVTEWKKDWGSNLLCQICNTPTIYDSIVCNTCNCIAHITCIDNQIDNDDHILIRRDETDEEDATMEYYCAECNQHEKSEKAYYNKELSRLKYERYLKQMVNRITSTIKTRIERIRFLKQRQLTITLQAMARRHFIRKRFHQLRRNQIRIIYLELVNMPKIDGACMIVWTVVDKYKNHQLFRLDKEINRAMNEGLLIPGTSANVSVYLTIIKSEGQNLSMVRQCQIALRDVNPFEENQIHSLTLSENIEWTPVETRVEKLTFQCHSSSSSHSAANTATDSEIPNATATASTASAIPSAGLSLSDSQQLGLLSSSPSPLDSVPSPSPSPAPPQSQSQAPRQVAQIRYTALNSVTSYCTHIHGPPLDILRRTADHYFHNPRNKNNNATVGGAGPERKTKWWVCVVELNLLFYQYLGDTKPRFSVYIAETSVFIPRDSVNSSSAMVAFPDKRKWLLDFETPYETKRFVSTVNESKKAMDGTSIYFKHQKQYSAKFSH